MPPTRARSSWASTDGPDRDAWVKRAGVVAAYRELRGHDHPDDALGGAPKPGQVEQYAAYRAAWTALGRPEIDQTEHELSNGQHRARIRAWEREQAWGPRYVGNELAGTRKAAAHHHGTATLRRAEAAGTADADRQARLHREADEAAALAETLDARVVELQQLDDARTDYLVHTAATRAAADRSRLLLAERNTDDAAPEQVVTAEEWLAVDRQARAEDDTHRAITEHDVPDERSADALDGDGVGDASTADAAVPDLREVAAAEPAQTNEDVIRVPTAHETADALTSARRALAEIDARAALDQQAEVEHRAEQLTRWHTDDSTADATDVRDLEPALARELG